MAIAQPPPKRPKPSRWTLEKYLELPEGPPYFEYEEGELIPVVAPNPDHQDVVDALVHCLKQYLRASKVGRALREVNVVLPQGQGYIPDITYISKDRAHILDTASGKIYGVPTLVVEATSSEPGRDRIRKRAVYEENAVAWYWIVEPLTLQIDELECTAGEYNVISTTKRGEVFRPSLFPGLEINLAALLGDEA